MPASISLRGLQVHYGKAAAVKDVSVEVAEASVTGIIGANGVAKAPSCGPYRDWYH